MRGQQGRRSAKRHSECAGGEVLGTWPDRMARLILGRPIIHARRAPRCAVYFRLNIWRDMHGDTILLMTFVFALVAAFAGGVVARALPLAAHRGLSCWRARGEPIYAGLHRRLGCHEPAVRGRRHVHDVQHGPAFLTQGPLRGQRHRGAGSYTADSRGYRGGVCVGAGVRYGRPRRASCSAFR